MDYRRKMLKETFAECLDKFYDPDISVNDILDHFFEGLTKYYHEKMKIYKPLGNFNKKDQQEGKI